MIQDTIVAIATARGRAGIGIIRISGANLGALIGTLFRPRCSGVEFNDRRAHLGEFMGEDREPIDEGLLLFMKAPHSYTGEDVVELHAHGSPWILDHLVSAVLATGARMAQPGEFTRRAYLNGRLDLIQADAVIQIINSSSARGLRAARQLLSGELSRRLEKLRARLVDVLKWLEMAIDFPEEDIEAASDEELARGIAVVGEEIAALLRSFREGRRARTGARVVLCGRANVGKSSLFNRLLGYRRSIVADVAGTTRDVVEAGFELDGLLINIQDTAGLRETLDVLESEGIGMTRDAIGAADLALVVVDASGVCTDEDRLVLETVERCGVPWVGVMNKDDLGRAEGWEVLPGKWIPVSTLNGVGVDVLRRILVEELVETDGEEHLLLTASWQKEYLERVLKNVLAAGEAITLGYRPDATAYELYEALDRLDELMGTRGRDEVVNRVFAEFCLGK